MLCTVPQHVVVFLRAADTGGLHPHGGREIGGAKAHGLQAGRGGCDGVDVCDACGGFDNDLKRDFLGAAHRGFDRGDQGVDGIDVLGAAYFGDHDHVQTLGCLFQQVHHVAVPIRGVERVDPDRHGFGAPIDCIDRLDDVGAGRGLVGGCDAILKVHVDDVCRRCRHFREQFGVGAGSEQLAAVWTGGGRGLQAEAHGDSLWVRKFRLVRFEC